MKENKLFYKDYILRLTADGNMHKLGTQPIRNLTFNEALEELVADGKVERYDLVRRTPNKSQVVLVYAKKVADGNKRK